ncbi:hypothetical protein H2200_008107 [Cladophialophora chaetospira]|uniref:RNase III domain-containing protein n=1 Tax=Cladophialophora chaetospira TaxID=386627 RepID=A0AA38X558_9EURO|nr:hypothetical protein H2200_008107 [Cladophialophora chaetospira]
MASLTNEYRVQKAADILGRHFRNVDYGSEALLAPHRETDQNGSEIASDGNRRLALLGRSVIETVLLTRWYYGGAERRSADTMINTLASKGAFADLALQNGLDSCVKRSRRQESGIMKPKTLKLTITAIIGAIFLDSGFNYGEVETVMERIG